MSQKKHFLEKSNSSSFMTSHCEQDYKMVYPRTAEKAEVPIDSIIYRKMTPNLYNKIYHRKTNSDFVPQFKNADFSPYERKSKELTESYNIIKNCEICFEPTSKLSNSLGLFQRIKNKKDFNSHSYDININRRDPYQTEEACKKYRNVSKERKRLFLQSDIFQTNPKKKEDVRTEANILPKKYIKKKALAKSNSTAQMPVEKMDAYENKTSSILEKEIVLKYKRNIPKKRHYLNLASQLDEFSMQTPKQIKNITYKINSNQKEDESKIRKLFSNSGLHVYNITAQNSVWNNTNINNNYNVNIRFDSKNRRDINKIKAIKLKLNYKGIQCQKVK